MEWRRREGRLQGNRASRPAGNLKWPASPTWTSRTDTNTDADTVTNTDTDTDTNTDTDAVLDLGGNMGECDELVNVEHNSSNFQRTRLTRRERCVKCSLNKILK